VRLSKSYSLSVNSVLRLQIEMLKENKELNLDTLDVPESDSESEVAPEPVDLEATEVPPSISATGASGDESEAKPPNQKRTKKEKAGQKAPNPPVVKLSKAEIRARQREEALRSTAIAVNTDPVVQKKGKRRKQGGLNDGTGAPTPVVVDLENDLQDADSLKPDGSSSVVERTVPIDEGLEEPVANGTSKRDNRKAKEAAKSSQPATSSSDHARTSSYSRSYAHQVCSSVTFAVPSLILGRSCSITYEALVTQQLWPIKREALRRRAKGKGVETRNAINHSTRCTTQMNILIL
jgi:hypothetical protein